MARSAPTILDVARAAGVSRQTVTRALNGLPDISPTTRDRVVEAARQLNYRPNRAAQGLVRGRDVAVGFVVEDFANPYFPELASALSRIAAEQGWSVILCEVGDDEDGARARISALLQRVDALVLTGCREDTVGRVPLEDLRGGVLGIPAIMLDGPWHDVVTGRVEIDHGSGVRAALDHLRGTGRRRIVMIDSAQLPGSAKTLAFRAWLAEHGAGWTPESVVLGEESHRGGVQAARDVLDGCPDADAVLVYNDVMAIGAMKGFTEAGVTVPHRMGVVGSDGLAIGELMTPGLTSLAIDKEELARHAVDLLAHALRGGPHTDAEMTRHVGLRLVIRASTAAPQLAAARPHRARQHP